MAHCMHSSDTTLTPPRTPPLSWPPPAAGCSSCRRVPSAWLRSASHAAWSASDRARRLLERLTARGWPWSPPRLPPRRLPRIPAVAITCAAPWPLIRFRRKCGGRWQSQAAGCWSRPHPRADHRLPSDWPHAILLWWTPATLPPATTEREDTPAVRTPLPALLATRRELSEQGGEFSLCAKLCLLGRRHSSGVVGLGADNELPGRPHASGHGLEPSSSICHSHRDCGEGPTDASALRTRSCFNV